jgi:DNA gyrase subunit A
MKMEENTKVVTMAIVDKEEEELEETETNETVETSDESTKYAEE